MRSPCVRHGHSLSICTLTTSPTCAIVSVFTMNTERVAMIPTEMLVVTFFEHPCLAVRGDDGTIYVSIRDLCDAVGLRTHSQLRRLRADEDLGDGIRTFRVMTPGGPQEQEFLILEFVPTWVSSVQRSRAAVAVREIAKYEHLPATQYADCVQYIQSSYRRLTGEDLALPEQTSLDLE
jgi:P22_AR N-terminal domain